MNFYFNEIPSPFCRQYKPVEAAPSPNVTPVEAPLPEVAATSTASHHCSHQSSPMLLILLLLFVTHSL